jgi:hypothetical protein
VSSSSLQPVIESVGRVLLGTSLRRHRRRLERVLRRRLQRRPTA